MSHNNPSPRLPSSKRAHNGSANHSSSSQQAKVELKAPTESTKQDQVQEQLVDRYVQGKRDYKSFAVEEYDPFQEEARKLHVEELKSVVGKNY